MTIVRERTKKDYIEDDSCPAYVDLSAMHLCFVTATGGATGSMEVTTPGGQGVLVYGVLLNDPAITETAALKIKGIAECRANETFNAGVELTVVGANGRVEAAASGDFVCAIAREASGGSGHCVSVTLVDYYKP